MVDKNIPKNIPDSLVIVWDSLYAMREDLIPEGDESYDSQWKEICFAMNYITAELGYNLCSNGDLVCVKPDMKRG